VDIGVIDGQLFAVAKKTCNITKTVINLLSWWQWQQPVTTVMAMVMATAMTTPTTMMATTTVTMAMTTMTAIATESLSFQW
jgi:hypothetical protein